MKKRAGTLVLILVLALMLTACGNSDSSDMADTKAGAVYFLNFKPEQDAAWQKLAGTYEDETGVAVTVVTAASGEYETTLMSEMGKAEAPTLFQVNGPVGLANWSDYCYDLSQAAVYEQVISDDYVLREGEEVKAIAYMIESYGLITNTKLLQQAGYTVEDIRSFADLKAVAEDISARAETLGFTAFTSAGMDDSSDWRFKTHLANLPIYFEYAEDGIESTDRIKGTYLENYRQIFDLYVENATCEGGELAAKTADDARNEFMAEEAVFYQNGSWEYNTLSETMDDEVLAMLPIYTGAGDEAKQGLCTGTENYWCVNRQAAEEDIAATLDFINWCVTSETGTKAMAEDMGFVIPFKEAAETPNVFVQQDARMLQEGKTPVTWDFSTIPSDEWKSALGSALTAYAADRTDARWEAVEQAFIEGWASEYELTHPKQ